MRVADSGLRLYGLPAGVFRIRVRGRLCQGFGGSMVSLGIIFIFVYIQPKRILNILNILFLLWF